MRMFFSDELSGLPPYRDLDFTIELHPGTRTQGLIAGIVG